MLLWRLTILRVDMSESIVKRQICISIPGLFISHKYKIGQIRTDGCLIQGNVSILYDPHRTPTPYRNAVDYQDKWRRNAQVLAISNLSLWISHWRILRQHGTAKQRRRYETATLRNNDGSTKQRRRYETAALRNNGGIIPHAVC